jgi:hypothetical protein
MIRRVDHPKPTPVNTLKPGVSFNNPRTPGGNPPPALSSESLLAGGKNDKAKRVDW